MLAALKVVFTDFKCQIQLWVYFLVPSFKMSLARGLRHEAAVSPIHENSPESFDVVSVKNNEVI